MWKCSELLRSDAQIFIANIPQREIFESSVSFPDKTARPYLYWNSTLMM
jgi:hypothetical protein